MRGHVETVIAAVMGLPAVLAPFLAELVDAEQIDRMWEQLMEQFLNALAAEQDGIEALRGWIRQGGVKTA
jgi:hypothetical protein